MDSKPVFEMTRISVPISVTGDPRTIEELAEAERKYREKTRKDITRLMFGATETDEVT